jgi:hypothetical protein
MEAKHVISDATPETIANEIWKKIFLAPDLPEYPDPPEYQSNQVHER